MSKKNSASGEVSELPERAARGAVNTSAGVKSAIRTVQLLEYLAELGGHPARLRDLAEVLDAPRSSTHMLVRTLEAQGWIKADLSGTLYTLGLRSLVTGGAFLESDNYVRVAHPVLIRLRDELSDTVHMGRIDEDRIIYLNTLESRRESRPFSRVGRWMPAHATALGKVLLAESGQLPTSELEPLTDNTITDLAELEAELTVTRERGYSVEREESNRGVGCVAVALRYSDPIIDALSCSMPIQRLTPDRISEVAAALFRARDELEISAPSYPVG